MVDIDKILELVQKEHKRRSTASSHAGHLQDAGERMKTNLFFYKAGRDGLIPSPWACFAERAEVESDPDWERYQELKAKFEK